MNKQSFFPGNGAKENSEALQEALDRGGEVRVDIPGVYEVSKPLLLGSDTALVCAPGVYFSRVQPAEESGPFLANKGLYTGEVDVNIRVEGVHLKTNGVQCAAFSESTKRAILGVRGHIVMMNVRDLVIRDFQVFDLEKKDYAVQITDFENILIENCRIEGQKDGIHLGPGNGFTIRRCIFRTFDDPLAFNGDDYSVSNPHLGWIENGLVEDCLELDDKDTTGFFCRLLAGGWVDWFPGMTVQHSDAVVHDGKLYRVFMSPNGEFYRSNTPPTVDSGIQILDGIRWVRTQDACYTAGCRNITFRNITLQKRRNVAFCFTLDTGAYLRSYYPNAEIPVQGGFVFDNIRVQNDVKRLIYINSPLSDLKVVNSDFREATIGAAEIREEGLVYPTTELSLIGNTYGNRDPLIAYGQPCRVRIAASTLREGANPACCGNLTVIESDL